MASLVTLDDRFVLICASTTRGAQKETNKAARSAQKAARKALRILTVLIG
jgi:hypothetical protein